MRKILLAISFSILFENIFSQPDSLLKSFKYRISHYREINFGSGGASSIGSTDYPSGTNKSNGSGASVGASGYFTKSTDRILLESSADLGGIANFGSFQNSGDENKYRNSSYSTNFNILNKWFNHNSFTELGAETSLNSLKNKSKGTNPHTDAQINQSAYSLTVHTGFGKGRLENITDMQNALWLYKALTGENKLSRSLSPDELNGLGSIITTANNTRVLDSRKKTQFILESIDGYFQKNGFINVTDIRYFSDLNDVLFFAFNNKRLAGTEKFIRLTPSISYSLEKQADHVLLTNIENKITTKSARLSAGFNRYHPVNLQHQNDFGVSLFLNYVRQDENEKSFDAGTPTTVTDFNPEIKQAGINLFFQHSIYPNTRTNINFNLSSETGYENIGASGLYSSTYLSGLLNYFISYRTRLICSLGASYLTNYERIYQDLALLPDNWQLNANAGIIISL